MFYVYKFIDSKDNVLYVGQTIDPDRRFGEHKGTIWDKEKDHIEFAKCNSCTDMNIYEMYYINKLHPKYNTAIVFNDEPSFELPELEWEIYDINHFENKKRERDNIFKQQIKNEFSPEIYWKKKKESLEEKINSYKDKTQDEYSELEKEINCCEEKINLNNAR